ncbi:MAG: type II toxin-antitoxin system HipA family toxin [Ignavibacteriae bacterium]|nr:MAG: type II toxin-antitoxin system HipA family toxin [Ignavibacteriota bacterium]
MIAEVQLWGTTIGAVNQDGSDQVAAFQFDEHFINSGIQVAPFMMSLNNRVYTFPELPFNTFHGLPGMLADSLPDRFGNAVIDTWLATQGRRPEDLSAVERLCYIGTRGMGALEFAPVIGPKATKATKVQVDELVRLAGNVLASRQTIRQKLDPSLTPDALRNILLVGTSAGGARAKALIAWDPITNEVRSGQVKTDERFEYWILKFDGVRGNKDKEMEDPQGYGAIEYAYSRMARDAGITMEECRLMEEGGRRHFMTRRFDRTTSGDKLHMQSLCALAHLDFNDAGAHSYERAFLVLQDLGLPVSAREQLYRRMIFNVVGRNQDDHVKNISFLMDKRGDWSLAPAYDVTYSYNPQGLWTSRHQMSINGKRDNFTRTDLIECAKRASISKKRAREIIDDVITSVNNWPMFAESAKIDQQTITAIRSTHRTEFPT